MEDTREERGSIPTVNRLAWYEADVMLMSMNAASPLEDEEAQARTLVLCRLDMSAEALCLDLERIVRALHERPDFYVGAMAPEDMCILDA